MKMFNFFKNLFEIKEGPVYVKEEFVENKEIFIGKSRIDGSELYKNVVSGTTIIHKKTKLGDGWKEEKTQITKDSNGNITDIRGSVGYCGVTGASGVSGTSGTSGNLGIQGTRGFNNCSTSVYSNKCSPKIYSDYLAENIDKSIKYSEYIAENINNSIAYSEYVAEQAERCKKNKESKRIYSDVDPYGEENW